MSRSCKNAASLRLEKGHLEKYPETDFSGRDAIRCDPGLRPRSHTFLHIFHFFHSTQKQGENRGHTKNFPTPKNFHFLIKTPKVHFSLFFILGENGGWSLDAPREGPNHARL